MEFLIFLLVVSVIVLLVKQNGFSNRLEEVERQNLELLRRLKPSVNQVEEPAPLQEEKKAVVPPAPPELFIPDLPKAEEPIPNNQAPSSAPTPPPLPVAKPAPVAARSEPARTLHARPLLEKLKLWPPSKEELDGTNPEVALAVFWTTRIGLILMIIAAVFFGVHLSQNTPNWVRASVLFLVSGGVFGLGVWLERRFAQFGRLISAGGLALAFFASFALFGVPATKVTDEPLVSLIAQLVSICLAIGWSVFRKDEIIATMSIFLGYVACWFSAKYGLSDFSLVALLVLAAAGAALYGWRGWRWPQVVAIGGSWIGLLLLALHPWQVAGQVPSFATMLLSICALITIFEAGAQLASRRHGDSLLPFWKKAIAIANTSGGVFVGVFAVFEHHPSLLSSLYLALSLLIAAAATTRFWPKRFREQGIAETFLLKSAALLSLYFVAEFEGPVRWLALALQTLALFVAWRRTRSIWIDLAAFALLMISIGFIEHGIFSPDFGNWNPLGSRSIVGAIALLLLGAILSLHGRWSQASAGEPLHFLRGALAIWIGITGLQLAFAPSGLSGVERAWFSTGLGIGFCVIAILIRTAPALVTGTLIILSSCGATIFGGFETGPESVFGVPVPMSQQITLFAFAALGAIGSELCYRLWKGQWLLGELMRFLYALISLGSLAAALHSLAPEYHSAIEQLLIPLFAIGGAGLIRMQARVFSEAPARVKDLRLVFATVVGVLTILLSCDHWSSAENGPAWLSFHLSLAAAILFGSALLHRARPAAALAGSIPLIFALASLCLMWDDVSPLYATLAALPIVIVAMSTAFFGWAIGGPDRPEKRFFDRMLHLIWMAALAWLFHDTLEPAIATTGTILVAIAATLLATRVPFRTLPSLAGAPLILSILGTLPLVFTSFPDSGTSWQWWIAAGLIPVWLIVWNRTKFCTEGPPTNVFVGFAGFLWATIGLIAAPSGWEGTTLAGFALVGAAIWRLRPMAGLLPVTFTLIGVSFLYAINQSDSLISGVICAALIALSGIALDGRRGKMNATLMLLPIASLVAAFLAFYSDRIGVGNWITVAWGATGIVLFLLGLAASLRSYRIVGLAGLCLCIVRMFIVDIDDTLYRIIAFFAIAVVLLVVGFLYHRFRDLIK